MEICYIFVAYHVKNVILNCVEITWSVPVKCIHLADYLLLYLGCRLPQLKHYFCFLRSWSVLNYVVFKNLVLKSISRVFYSINMEIKFKMEVLLIRKLLCVFLLVYINKIFSSIQWCDSLVTTQKN